MTISRGFTLIELLIAIAIVGILGSIAYPSYTNSVTKTRREEGKRTLIEAAQQLESYYAMNLTYIGGAPTTSADFDKYYVLSAATATSSFTLTATPKSGTSQESDSCGPLIVNSSGDTTATISGCW